MKAEDTANHMYEAMEVDEKEREVGGKYQYVKGIKKNSNTPPNGDKNSSTKLMNGLLIQDGSGGDRCKNGHSSSGGVVKYGLNEQDSEVDQIIEGISGLNIRPTTKHQLSNGIQSYQRKTVHDSSSVNHSAFRDKNDQYGNYNENEERRFGTAPTNGAGTIKRQTVADQLKLTSNDKGHSSPSNKGNKMSTNFGVNMEEEESQQLECNVESSEHRNAAFHRQKMNEERHTANRQKKVEFILEENQYQKVDFNHNHPKEMGKLTLETEMEKPTQEIDVLDNTVNHRRQKNTSDSSGSFTSQEFYDCVSSPDEIYDQLQDDVINDEFLYIKYDWKSYIKAHSHLDPWDQDAEDHFELALSKRDRERRGLKDPEHFEERRDRKVVGWNKGEFAEEVRDRKVVGWNKGEFAEEVRDRKVVGWNKGEFAEEVRDRKVVGWNKGEFAYVGYLPNSSGDEDNSVNRNISSNHSMGGAKPKTYSYRKQGYKSRQSILSDSENDFEEKFYEEPSNRTLYHDNRLEVSEDDANQRDIDKEPVNLHLNKDSQVHITGRDKFGENSNDAYENNFVDNPIEYRNDIHVRSDQFLVDERLNEEINIENSLYFIVDCLCQSDFASDIETLESKLLDNGNLKAIIEDNTHVFALINDTVKLRPEIILCADHVTFEGCTNKSVCRSLHLCDEYVLDICDEQECIKGHNIFTTHNRNILRDYYMDCLEPFPILSLLRKSVCATERPQNIKVCENSFMKTLHDIANDECTDVKVNSVGADSVTEMSASRSTFADVVKSTKNKTSFVASVDYAKSDVSTGRSYTNETGNSLAATSSAWRTETGNSLAATSARSNDVSPKASKKKVAAPKETSSRMNESRCSYPKQKPVKNYGKHYTHRNSFSATPIIRNNDFSAKSLNQSASNAKDTHIKNERSGSHHQQRPVESFGEHYTSGNSFAATPVTRNDDLSGRSFNQSVAKPKQTLTELNVQHGHHHKQSKFWKAREVLSDMMFGLTNTRNLSKMPDFHSTNKETVWSHNPRGDIELPEICARSLSSDCPFKTKRCKRLHATLPYHWQIKTSADVSWLNLQQHQVIFIENAYCNPDVTFMQLPPPDVKALPNIMNIILKGETWYVNFQSMTVSNVTETEVWQLRRLMVQDGRKKDSCKDFLWYFKNNDDKWVPYGHYDPSVSSRHATEISSYEIEKRFRGGQPKTTISNVGKFNTYVIDFKMMHQKNINTGVVREVRRRPYILVRSD